MAGWGISLAAVMACFMLLEKRKLRVAAYCRVSTARDEQLVSLAAQKAHYENYIKSNDEWEFAGL